MTFIDKLIAVLRFWRAGCKMETEVAVDLKMSCELRPGATYLLKCDSMLSSEQRRQIIDILEARCNSNFIVLPAFLEPAIVESIKRPIAA